MKQFIFKQRLAPGFTLCQRDATNQSLASNSVNKQFVENMKISNIALLYTYTLLY